MSQDPGVCHKVEISGRVQGVGYRYWMLQSAETFGVTGWVRNTTQGTVEAVVCGKPENVKLLLEACKKGPRFANVNDVIVVGTHDGQFDHFEAKRTV